MKRKNWLPFIILNIIISAVTTLIVLMIWNRAHPPQELVIQVPVENGVRVQGQSTPVLNPATLPPLEEEVMDIRTVIAPGDAQNEFVILDRLGEGALTLTGWYLQNQNGQQFVFPEFQILQGSVEVYSRAGSNTVNKLFWGTTESMWRSGESVRLFDFAGQERAVYQIP
ncbi:MAG: hypothetical protein CL609_23940 [Anaerolineaceae bacterium]|nr:hypothetical protein [Anaerolineaceae bacterium]